MAKHGGGSLGVAIILLLLYCILWPIGVMEKELRRWRLLFQPRWKRTGSEERHPWGNAKFRGHQTHDGPNCWILWTSQAPAEWFRRLKPLLGPLSVLISPPECPAVRSVLISAGECPTSDSTRLSSRCSAARSRARDEEPHPGLPAKLHLLSASCILQPWIIPPRLQEFHKRRHLLSLSASRGSGTGKDDIGERPALPLLADRRPTW
jgi:hypothetical protein